MLDRLPPKFLADDPELVHHSHSRKGQQKILLPDGSGGVQSVENNIVRIEHKGQIVELIALSPQQRQKRQRLTNFIAVLLGALFLILFFLWQNW